MSYANEVDAASREYATLKAHGAEAKRERARKLARDGLTVSEIARILGKSQTFVRRAVQRMPLVQGRVLPLGLP